ncbi:MAG TPA: LuxR C-terminal-related transcriptional regulator [Gaiellaceae bacterium]|jgi:two-component system response regulator NreC|nr:LuxR C-terminal-related transcriptional regulator [Gaiellaceae bacterium]
MQAEPVMLTGREEDVLRLLALGYTNREIASELRLSVRTVEFHRASMRRKLGLGGRKELVRFALSNGIVRQA